MRLGRSGAPVAALALGAGLALLAPLSVRAVKILDGYEAWSSSQIANGSRYAWSSLVPEWLKDPMQKTLEVNWADPDRGNWNGIRFIYAANGKGTVDYSNLSACNKIRPVWIACARGAGSSTWRITIRQDVKTPWCQKKDLTKNCWDVYRIGVHEVAHAGGYLYDNLDAQEADSIMGDPHTGMNQRDFVQRCDEAQFQLWYGLKDLDRPYASCFEGLADAGPGGGLKTRVTLSSSLPGLCAGGSVVLSGRLVVQNLGYGALRGNELAGRELLIYRVTPERNFVLGRATATDAANGPNWSLKVTYATRLTTTFRILAEFAPFGSLGRGLEPARSDPVSVTWYRDVDC